MYFCRTATVRIVSWKEIDFYRWNFVWQPCSSKWRLLCSRAFDFEAIDAGRYTIYIYTCTHTCHTRRNQRPGITRSENWWIFNESRVRRTVFYGRGQLYLSSLPVQLGFKMKRFRYEREGVFFFFSFWSSICCAFKYYREIDSPIHLSPPFHLSTLDNPV